MPAAASVARFLDCRRCSIGSAPATHRLPGLTRLAPGLGETKARMGTEKAPALTVPPHREAGAPTNEHP